MLNCISRQGFRGLASFKNSESLQDFQLFNPHSPNQDIVVLALIKILQTFHKNNYQVVSYFFTVLFHFGTVPKENCCAK